MNEAETRAELIDPKLKAAGWGIIEGSKVLREYNLTAGRIQTGGRAKPLIADYVLVYHNRKLAVIEAKSDNLPVSEGVAQAKNYAVKLQLETTYSSNGREIYQICMKTGTEGLVSAFSSPDELWNKTFSDQNHWRDQFDKVPFEDVGGSKGARYYQEIAVNNTMLAIAKQKQRVLLTLATGTGKTFIAFQIAWKLFQSRWNLKRDGSRRPRILFLADRNILANQAFNAFSAFPEDALVRISPKEINKNGKVPTNGSIFFTIFQTFMSGANNTPYFGQYPADFFDFIIIDECHRGGANDEGNWREIQYMVSTLFYSADGNPMSVEEFLKSLYGTLPNFFKDEEQFRKLWANPITRKAFLEQLSDAGYEKEQLLSLQKLINAEKSDLFDVLEFVAYAAKPITREERVAAAKPSILLGLDEQQREFIEFVLSKYIETGIDELDQEKLPSLLELKYHALSDASAILGGVEKIRDFFIGFQKYLYQVDVA